MQKNIAATALALAMVLFPVAAFADTVSTDFESYAAGTVNAQDGWSSTGAFDHKVDSSFSTPTFGTQSLRISDAVTNGSFGDQTFSKSVLNEAGETDALNGGMSGGTRQPHFEAQFDLASVLPLTQQPGMHVSVSPDRGDGARMSYLRFEDNANGVDVFFDDVQGTVPNGVDGCTSAACGNFVETKIATLDRSTPHTIKFSMDFLDGPSNDVVKIYIDSVLIHTGTSWEDYFRFDPESNPSLVSNSRTVDSLLFRTSGTANTGDAGNGFLIDNLTLTSGPIVTDAPGCSALTLVSGTGSKTAGYTATNPVDAIHAMLSDIYSGSVFASAFATQAVIPPWVDPATDGTFTGSGALWASTDPTWPGGSGNTEGVGNDDQWRTFEHGFALPVGAVVSSATVSFTGDNAADVYLNGNTTPLATTNDVYGAVPGALPQYFASVYNAPFTPTTGYNHLNFVLRNWGGDFPVNPTGLLYKAVINYCIPPPPPTSVVVHIFKYLDDAVATAVTANNAVFPMYTATYSAGYPLAPTGYGPGDAPYEASTSPIPVGQSYTTNEVIDNVTTGASCDAGTPFAFVGYKVGTTLSGAEAAPVTTTVPNFTNLQSDEYILVINHPCPPVQKIKVHILKYLDGVEATAGAASNYQFPMTATWMSANLNGGVSTSGGYVLGNSHGGAASVYGADTSPMTVPADYTTTEVTSDLDGTSQVIQAGGACVAGKYRLVGYKSSETSFADAAAQPTASIDAPVYTALTSDRYVIVLNEKCPTVGSLTVNKVTVGGNATFSFTGDNGIGAFQITTTANAGSVTFNNLTPGVYHITEATKTGWTMTDAGDCPSVTVTAGGAAECTFINTNNKLLGAIIGSKIEDRDGDGKLSDGDHHRLSGWTIYIDTNNNGALDNNEPSTITNSRGNYRFVGLVAGTYVVREVQQTGWTQTYPATGKYTIVLAAGKVSKKNNFGNFKLGTISGMKYNDMNANGRKDTGEVGLQGWTIQLKKGNTVVQTAVTDANGAYSFTNLGPGVYKLSEVMQATWRQTDRPGSVTVRSGTNALRKDFGNTQKPKSGHDRDDDSQRDN